jgi:hypothetical protein
MTVSSKAPLYRISMPSTEFSADASLCVSGGFPTLRFDYCRGGVAYRSGIRFKRVLATRTRSERCCTAWHIEDAYDTLVEVSDSPWAHEIQEDMPPRWRGEQSIHHYMIYLDSAGCFELLAESWEMIPEENGTWNTGSPN